MIPAQKIRDAAERLKYLLPVHETGTGTIDNTIRILDALAAEREQPAPRFKVGDRVRVVGKHGMHGRYNRDCVTHIDKAYWGESCGYWIYELSPIWLRAPHNYVYTEDTLAPAPPECTGLAVDPQWEAK